jgi:hypothetical protein
MEAETASQTRSLPMVPVPPETRRLIYIHKKQILPIRLEDIHPTSFPNGCQMKKHGHFVTGAAANSVIQWLNKVSKNKHQAVR